MKQIARTSEHCLRLGPAQAFRACWHWEVTFVPRALGPAAVPARVEATVRHRPGSSRLRESLRELLVRQPSRSQLPPEGLPPAMLCVCGVDVGC